MPFFLEKNFFSFFSIGNIFWASQFLIAQSYSYQTKWNLSSEKLRECSGLELDREKLFYINDSKNEARVYVSDTISGKIIHSTAILGAVNHDWEDLASDGEFLYIGDFGNNNGNRTNLAVLKVNLNCILTQISCPAEHIFFERVDQKDFHYSPHKHNFDFEAITCMGDSLLLFSKNWLDQKTRVYVLPKQAGEYKINPRATWPISGLITGADYSSTSKILVLCGYNKGLPPQPFVCLIKNFDFKNVSGPVIQKISNYSSFPLQIEGVIIHKDGRIWLCHEETVTQKIKTPAALGEIRNQPKN